MENSNRIETAPRSTPFQTIPDASKSTGLSQYFIRSGCKAGTVPHIRCGSKYLVNVPALVDKLGRQAGEGAGL